MIQNLIKSRVLRKWNLPFFPYTHDKINECTFTFEDRIFFVGDFTFIGNFTFIKDNVVEYSFCEAGILSKDLNSEYNLMPKEIILGISDDSLESIEMGNMKTYLHINVECKNSFAFFLEIPDDFSALLFVHIFDFFLDYWNKAK